MHVSKKFKRNIKNATILPSVLRCLILDSFAFSSDKLLRSYCTICTSTNNLFDSYFLQKLLTKI